MQATDEYEQFLAELRRETGVEALAADESGLASIRVDDKYNLNLHFIEATGKILCFVEVAMLPQDAPAAVGKYGQNKGFVPGKDGGGARFFAIDPGHSLEGESKNLRISDDLSFKDTSFKRHIDKRFANFSALFNEDYVQQTKHPFEYMSRNAR